MSRPFQFLSLLARIQLPADFPRNHLVDITPDPILSRLNRTDHRMMFVMKVLGGVFVLRLIAASHFAAHHAHPQMNPGGAKFDALFANVFVGGRDLDLIEMLALA